MFTPQGFNRWTRTKTSHLQQLCVRHFAAAFMTIADCVMVSNCLKHTVRMANLHANLSTKETRRFFSAIFTVQSLSHLLLPFEGISWFVRGTHDSIDFLFGFFHHPAIGASWLWRIRKGGNSPKKAQEKHECKIRVFLVRNCGYWKVWSSISILTVISKNHSSWCSLLRDILLNVSMQIKYELCSRKKMICKRQFLVHVVFTSW